jgi:hypothetical protein
LPKSKALGLLAPCAGLRRDQRSARLAAGANDASYVLTEKLLHGYSLFASVMEVVE